MKSIAEVADSFILKLAGNPKIDPQLFALLDRLIFSAETRLGDADYNDCLKIQQFVKNYHFTEANVLARQLLARIPKDMIVITGLLKLIINYL
jgi:hypothetical protein